jgi:hypothetical protein
MNLEKGMSSIPFYKKIKAVFESIYKRFPVAKMPNLNPSLPIPSVPEVSNTNGTLSGSSYSYRITALTEYGESLPSEREVFINSQDIMTPEIVNSSYSVGNLSSGIYNYKVTAIGENGGETLPSDAITIELKGMPCPIMDEFLYPSTTEGILIPGDYYYRVTAFTDLGETLPTTIYQATINSTTNTNNIKVRWLPVLGAIGYKIYGRSESSQSLIGIVFGESSDSFIDDGRNIPNGELPIFNTTNAGIQINWRPVLGSFGYRIYGREKDNFRLIGEVSSSIHSFVDDGNSEPTTFVPEEDTTDKKIGGCKLKWQKVPGAIGYRVYGRTINSEKLLFEVIGGNNTEFIDDGTYEEEIDITPPEVDSSSGRYGKLGMVIPDGETITITPNGMISVKGGIDSFLGRAILNDLSDGDIFVYDKFNLKWVNYNFKTLLSIYMTKLPVELEAYANRLTDLLNKNIELEQKLNTQTTEIELLKSNLEKLKLEVGIPLIEEEV